MAQSRRTRKSSLPSSIDGHQKITPGNRQGKFEQCVGEAILGAQNKPQLLLRLTTCPNERFFDFPPWPIEKRRQITII
jgi:hypothetical protein